MTFYIVYISPLLPKKLLENVFLRVVVGEEASNSLGPEEKP